VLAVALALIAWKRPRLHPVRWTLLVGLLGLALLQVRHQAMLAIVAAMILPASFSIARPVEPVGRARFAVVLAGAALAVTARALMPLAPPENAANPWALIAAVPPELRSQPVLNGYSMGGPLILSGIRPYVDGRGDMYGDELVVGYSRIVHGDSQALGEAVQQWKIRWAILPNNAGKLIALLDRTPGWRPLRRDQVGVIYVRDGA
jgi:hypothetical protein